MGARAQANDSRRGVLLLVVLSMLTLFLLLGTTYVIMAARARATAKAFRKMADSQTQAVTTWRPALKDAVLEVIRGSENIDSVIGVHDLLRDKYGQRAAGYGVSSSSLTAGDQLLRLDLTDGPDDSLPADLLSLCGRVLTFADGPEGVKNTSTRIFQASTAPPQVYVLCPKLLTSSDLPLITKVHVNSREFSGAGFNDQQGGPPSQMDLSDRALKPNQRLDRTLGETPFDGGNEDYDAIDEQNMALASSDGLIASYHRPAIVDHWVRQYATASGKSDDDSRSQLAALLLGGTPSDADEATALLRLRQSILRPFPFDHYEDDARTRDFTGRPLTGVGLTPLDGNDVDTDGDGIRDSIWLDLGRPTLQMPDGTRVKPLFAIRCLDLQGRLNLNVHGSTVHPFAAVNDDPRLAARLPEQDAVSPEKTLPLPLGQGFGAADVRLDTLLGRDLAQAALAGRESAAGSVSGMTRNVGNIFGRYGDRIGTATDLPRPGQRDINDTRPGGELARDLWPWPRLAEDFDYWMIEPDDDDDAFQRTVFGGSPPDYWGRYAIGIDRRGHPLAINRLPGVALKEAVDTPYEFDPGRYPNPRGTASTGENAWIDQPFTPAELEALLRPFDVDNTAALPQRAVAMAVAAAAGSAADFADLRNAVTTLSWDTPLVVLPGPEIPAWDVDKHDWDLVRGLKIDLNRPFGDGLDNTGNGVVDDYADTTAGESGDAYAEKDGTGWQITRGNLPQGFIDLDQPGPNVPTLRARQLFAYHMFNLFESLHTKYRFFLTGMDDPGSRLFAIDEDDADDTPDDRNKPPKAKDATLDTVQKQRDHTKRVLAQWAVNIVDFLDADAIMTPFRYQKVDDVNAPNAWSRHVVWGCEYPDLMITETLAFHDRGVADTDQDDGSKSKTTDPPQSRDPDFDQVRLPQGSLFIELHATRSPNIPNPPAELYFREGNSWRLDVGKPAPKHPDFGFKSPIWRLSIARRDKDATLKNDPFEILAKYPDTEWLMPHGGSKLGGDSAVAKPAGDRNVAIRPDRYIWLSDPDLEDLEAPEKADATIDGDDGFPHRDNTFRVRNGTPPRVPRGGYLVIGPRASTPVGSIQSEGPPGEGGAPPLPQYGVPSPQTISLNPGQPTDANPAVAVRDLGGNPNPTGPNLPPPGNRSETVAAIVALDPPAGWSQEGVGTRGIGLNVSEPLRDAYYPTEPPIENEATGVFDLFEPGQFPDAPFDEDPAGRGRLNDGGSGPHAIEPAPAAGTVPNFATVILERLADPLRPHDPRVKIDDQQNPDWNPYIPLDFQPVDLTIFSGESDAIPTSPTAPLPRREEFPPRFYTRQRGFGSDLQRFDNLATLTGNPGDKENIVRNANPWKPLGSTADLDIGNVHERPSEEVSSQANFRYELNQPNRPPPAEEPPTEDPAPPDWNTIPFHSLGWVNSSYGRRLRGGQNNVPPEYDGAPDKPFPAIAWNDRPFANAYELLLVPRTAPSRLFTNFRPLDLTGIPDAQPTADGAWMTATVPADMFGAQTPGAHLFPLTSITDRPLSNGRYSRNAEVFGRVFEFVRVPTAFATATVAIDPATLNKGEPAERFFLPPFNRVPLYREPGGVNLNTIPRASPNNPDPAGINGIGERVWAALRGEQIDAEGTPPAPRFIPGTTPPPDPPASVADARKLPSGYELPFRAMRAGRFDFIADKATPTNTLIANGLIPDASSLDGQLSPRNFTLLGDAILGTGPSAPRPSLFTPVLHPEADASASNPDRDPRLHPWFGFQPLIRAASNSTVRSETYAVWVTLGLFEVQPSPAYTWNDLANSPQSVPANAHTNNPYYPDGYRLVREYGSDSGQITRYRAFFLYDRSIPVDYAPGEDRNVQQGILLERFVE